MIYHIKDSEWEAILKYLKEIKGLPIGCEKELRIFIEGLWFKHVGMSRASLTERIWELEINPPTF